MEQVTITPHDAAEMTGLTPRGIRKRCASGEIKAVKLGRRWLIDRAEFVRQLGIEDGEANE